MQADADTPVEVSHPDKVIFPDDGITKGEIVEYYARVAPLMLPHLRGRPLTLQRFPSGIGSKGFMQKDIGTSLPIWINRVTVEKLDGGSTTYAVCDDLRSLTYLANLNCVVFHRMLVLSDRPKSPDRLVFDLDPSSDDDFAAVRDGARMLRDMLGDLGLKSFVMTTGSRGLHVVVPLKVGPEVEQVYAFALSTASSLARKDPDRFTVGFRKAERHGRIYLDVARNGFAQTCVVPYSVRARNRAPVAVPVAWEELSSSELRPDVFTIENLFRLLGRRTDPWNGMESQALPPA